MFSGAVTTCGFMTVSTHMCEGEPVGMRQSAHTHAHVGGKCETVSEPQRDRVLERVCVCVSVGVRRVRKSVSVYHECACVCNHVRKHGCTCV